MEQRRADRVIPLFRHALSLYPELSACEVGIGRALFQAKHSNEVINAYRRAVTIDSDNTKLHYQLGQAYLKAEKKAAAQKQFAKTLAL